MAGRTLHRLVATSLAITGTALLGVTPAVSAWVFRPATTTASVTLLGSGISEIMGGSGTPIPPQSYIDAVTDRYIDPPGGPAFPGQPIYPGFVSQGLFTPEGASPLYSGIKSLPLDPSVAQGQTILNDTISGLVGNGNPNGNDLTVLGYSQSAVITSLEIRDLANTPGAPSVDDLHFVLLGNLMNPNGGVMERFDGLTIPSLEFTMNGATPPDTPYDTAIYTAEYDGFADFPRYPINFLADLNAVLGIALVHGTYPRLTPEELATAIPVETSAGYTGNTDYFVIPTENLPLLAPLRALPLIGTPLANLLQPDLKVLINLGYGSDPAIGWSTPADQPTPFGLFPNADPAAVFSALAAGAQQGVASMASSVSAEAAALTNPAALLQDVSSANAIADIPNVLASLAAITPTDIVNGLTAALADSYATLLPTADIATFVFATLPAYNVSLFLDNLANPIDAIGLPIAADVGLLTTAAGIQALVLIQQAEAVFADLSSIVPS